jgi:hypothetical protein
VDKSGTTEQPDDSVIRFACKYCQRRISVPKIHAGKKGKCPKCKNIIVVPSVESAAAAAPQSISDDSKLTSKGADFKLTFLDIPQEQKAQPATPDKTLEDLRKLEAEIATDEAELVPKRKLPWLIDIFLYPISTPGLIILAIIMVIPLLIDFVATLLGPFGFFVSVPGFVINIVISLYMYWYLCECIRDSAEGNLRAPDVLVRAPSLGDMLWQTIRIAGCLVFFCAPVLIYHRHTERTDTIFWSLLTYAVFFFPMGLLAVIMFDSFSGLNPILLVSSIFSTFFQYCGLILFFCACVYLFVKITSALPWSGFLNYIPVTAAIYLAMVAAHLLGRFYRRYREKLYWEV